MKYIAVLLLLIVLVPAQVGAQGQTGVNTGTPGSATVNTKSVSSPLPTLKNPIAANNITELLTKIADLIIFIGIIVAILMFIFIGFKFVWAQGNPEAISDARRWFMYAVIGTAILISSKVIVQVIKNTFIQAGVVNEDFFNNKNL